MSITVPDTVKNIEVAAFKDCIDLVEVDIPLRLLRVVMRDIGAYFGGIQFVVLLAQDGKLWKRYEEVRQAMEEEEMVGDEMDEEEDEEDELMSKTNKE